MSVIVLNTDASTNGKTLLTAETNQTVTGVKTFDLDPNAPFAVSSGSAKVTFLDADKLDGKEGSEYATLLANTFVGDQTINGSVFGQVSVQGATVVSVASFYESGRGFGMGVFQNVAYSDSNYSGDGTDASWVVQIGDQVHYRWSLIGKTINITIRIATSTVASAPAELQVVIPSGFTSANETSGAFYYSDNGTAGLGRWHVGASEQIIRFAKVSGNWTNSTNLTDVQASMMFELA